MPPLASIVDMPAMRSMAHLPPPLNAQPLPPAIITEKGESLDEFAERSSPDFITSLQVCSASYSAKHASSGTTSMKRLQFSAPAKCTCAMYHFQIPPQQRTISVTVVELWLWLLLCLQISIEGRS
jgi:hypothetical protein